MEGKVELSIKRYEELTKLERDGNARVAELEANMDKIMITRVDYGYSTERTSTQYQIKEEFINDLIKDKTEATESKDNAVREKHAVIQKYKEASFGKRFKYLWTGKLE